MAFVLDVTNSISTHEKIHRRSGHVSVIYKNWMIVWGGYVDHEQETPIALITSAYHSTDELWVYDCCNELWDRILTKGDIPPRNSGSCGVVHGHMLYIFGGFHGLNDPGAMDGNSNQLYRLDLLTLTWEWLHPTGTQPTPCDKLAGWEYLGKLYFFGGFGPKPEYHAPFHHVVDPSTYQSGWPRGWNNQLVVYNPKTNEWEWPIASGQAPSPRAAHAADITGSKVFVFGGRIGNVRNNELHCLDLDKLSWSGNLTRRVELNPEGRSWHSFTFIKDTRAVVYGGLNQFNTVLSDCWFLDLSPAPLRWYRFRHRSLKPRLWHKAQYVAACGELLILGGHKANILDPVGRKVSFLFVTDDCWLLDIHSDGLDLEWMEFTLPYDHGEPRCAHTACVYDGELLIHSGSTQPFFETRLKLKDHAEEMLIIRFTPKSLKRLCLDAVVYNEQLRPEWSSLPTNLYNLLEERYKQS